MLKGMGILLIAGCLAYTGIAMASGVRRELSLYRELQFALTQMKNEIKFRMTPLPELFFELSVSGGVETSLLFRTISDALRTDRDLSLLSIVQKVLRSCIPQMPEPATFLLLDLAAMLGKYDLDGQVRAIDLALQRLTELEARLSDNHAARCRSYQAMGVCAALAACIILL